MLHSIVNNRVLRALESRARACGLNKWSTSVSTTAESPCLHAAADYGGALLHLPREKQFH